MSLRLRALIEPVHLWHLASLDAPTVAVVWAWAFAWAAHVSLPGWMTAALALIVWTIYIGDRLLDARAGLRTPPEHELRERHYFHWRHRRVLLPAAALAAVAAAVVVMSRLPARSIRPDSIVAAATLLWLTSVHTRRRMFSGGAAHLRGRVAEIVVGALFVIGCALPVCSQVGAAHSVAQFLRLPLAAIVVFAALAWLNLHAIAVWESQRAARVRWAAVVLAVTALGLAVFCGPRSGPLLIAAACSALLLALLDCLRGRISALSLRAAADLVLLTPVVLLLEKYLRG
ncbi:hypothetical protein [Terracidiphilus gabretensis]|uniref:hypothetical protein n=1 Tax=Terracidiphilus gabretensis TaxID=1577687 RepID=UPI0012FA3B0E|nr:hypothetical protein [Terracidiphilus gabretensis]